MSRRVNSAVGVSASHNKEHILKKLEEYSHFLSEDEVLKAKHCISEDRILVLSSNIETLLYSSFVLGKSLTEVAEHHAYPIEMVVLTALHYNWWKREARDSKESKIEGIETTANSIAESCLLIVGDAVKKQMQEISNGKADSRESLELVSLAMKEMKSIAAFIGSMKESHKLMNASSPPKPMVQISNQTLNMSGQQQTKTEVLSDDKKMLPSTPEDRIKDLEQIESLGK